MKFLSIVSATCLMVLAMSSEASAQAAKARVEVKAAPVPVAVQTASSITVRASSTSRTGWVPGALLVQGFRRLPVGDGPVAAIVAPVVQFVRCRQPVRSTIRSSVRAAVRVASVPARFLCW